MRRRPIPWIRVLTAALALASLVFPMERAVAACPPGWGPVAMTTPEDSQLNGVATISQSDAWAVGFHGHPFATLTMHWDGASWTMVPSPNGTVHRNVLYAVSATGPEDVWAVGYQYVDANQGGVALVEHWDGHAWSMVPAHAGGSSVLYGVKAFAPDDVWAVGSRGSYPPEVTLTEHWDGNAWTVVPSPSPGVADRLHAVDGTSGLDVWAVGSTYRSAPTAHGLILHWDGAAWTRERGGAGPDGVYTFLLATTAITAGDAWAMGETGPSLDGYVPVLTHWNGSRWDPVPGPAAAQAPRIFGADAVGPGDVWAVGGRDSAYGGLSLLRWDGARWTREPTHDPRGGETLEAVSLLPTGDGWAVGWEDVGDGTGGLALRACGV